MNIIPNKNKMAIGTVQFGIPYGIANVSGQVSVDEVIRILALAEKNGVKTIDTAIAYGDSEKVLGRNNLSQFSVITKIPTIPDDILNVTSWLESQVKGSLSRLNISSYDGLLLHNPMQLMKSYGKELYRRLEAYKEEGIVNRIGISVYSSEELDLLCDYFHFDLVQAPLNIIDNRLIDSGWLERLRAMGTSLHVRSIFMQGLLLLSKEQRPEKFNHWKSLWDRLDRWLEETGQTPLQACLMYALSFSEVEKVVVGVDSFSQFEQILNALNDNYYVPPEYLHTKDVQLLNPSCWRDL